MFQKSYLIAFILCFSTFLQGSPPPPKQEKQPFWHILMQLGGPGAGAKKRGYRAIEDFIRYTKASLYNTTFGKKAKSYQNMYDEQLATFDLGDIYDALPYKAKANQWKASHIYEKSEKGKVKVTLGDPKLARWLTMSRRDLVAPWKAVTNLGDSDQRFYVTPRRKKNGATHYEAYYFERLGLGKIRTLPMLLGVEALLTYLERGVRNVPPSFKPSLVLQNRFSELSQGELYVMARFKKDMPSLYQKTFRYIDVHGISVPLKYKGGEYCRFNLHISLRMKGLKQDFPHIYKYLQRIKGLLNFRSRMYSRDGSYVGFMRFTTSNYTFHFSYCMKDGRFLPSSSDWEPKSFKGFGPQDLGTQKYYFQNDIKMEVNGIRVILRNLKLTEKYTHLGQDSTMEFRFNQAPLIQKIDGRAYGIVPIWLIDLLIPSNVESLLKDFFTALARGRQGQGWFLKIQTHTSPKNSRVELAVGSEMLSNGVIKMGMKIAADLLIPDKATSKEFNRFGKVFWHAFVQDYFRFRYAK